jgi:hypothetical protein
MGKELTAIFLLAFLAEAMTEYLFSDLLERIKDGKYCFTLKYIACVIGIALCVAYRIDLLGLVADLTPTATWIGWVVSGMIIGRGSNFLNDVIDRVRGTAAYRK